MQSRNASVAMRIAIPAEIPGSSRLILAKAGVRSTEILGSRLISAKAGVRSAEILGPRLISVKGGVCSAIYVTDL